MNARRLLLAVLVLLLILHQDFWNWHQLRWVAGLPSGFLYQVTYCIVVAVTMAVLLRQDRDNES